MLRFENEAEELLHYLKQTGLHPGLDGKLESSGDDEVVVVSDDGTPRGLAQRRRDGLRARRAGARLRGRRCPRRSSSPATATAASPG